MISDIKLNAAHRVLVVTATIPKKTQATIHMAATNEMIRSQARFAALYNQAKVHKKCPFHSSSMVVTEKDYEGLHRRIIESLVKKIDKNAIHKLESKQLFSSQGRGRLKDGTTFLWGMAIYYDLGKT